jgi:diguanylate cyclase (GGDEF)-like protein
MAAAMPVPVVLLDAANLEVLYANSQALELLAITPEMDWRARTGQCLSLTRRSSLGTKPLDPRPEFSSQEVQLKRANGERFRARLYSSLIDGTLIVMLVDFSDQDHVQAHTHRMYRQEKQRAEVFEALNKVSGAVLATLDLDLVLESLLNTCLEVLPIDSFYVAVYDEQSGLISHPLFYDNGERRKLPPRLLESQPGVAAEIIRTASTIYLLDTDDPQVRERYPIVHTGGIPTRSYVGTPLVAQGQVVGVVSMQSYQPQAYSPEQVRLFELIAAQTALAVENSRLFARSQEEIAKRKKMQADLQAANAALVARLAEIEDLQRQLGDLVVRDPLTGLFNRRYLDEILARELARAARMGYPVGLMMIDIDHFKVLNDAHGHLAGDELLKGLAELLHSTQRFGDVACRYGGEEFVLVLPGLPAEAAHDRAEGWRQAFERLVVEYRGRRLQRTISIGIASFPGDAQSAEQLLYVADQRMYIAKRLGRNRVHPGPDAL